MLPAALPAFAFVDLETTGTHAAGDRITEIGIVRVDYAFLKHAFARAGRAFTARVLCTVRLSRRLYPDAQGHGLDAVIARHALDPGARHRALGDARAIWQFVQRLYDAHPRSVVDEAIKRLLRIPSLPAQLPPDALDALPEGPGVYLFLSLIH